MPRKGYATITVSEKLYKKAAEKAEQLDKSVSRLVTDVLNDYLQEVPASG